jgi:hypothetical protein
LSLSVIDLYYVLGIRLLVYTRFSTRFETLKGTVYRNSVLRVVTLLWEFSSDSKKGPFAENYYFRRTWPSVAGMFQHCHFLFLVVVRVTLQKIIFVGGWGGGDIADNVNLLVCTEIC